jgi:molecular chaperone HscB
MQNHFELFHLPQCFAIDLSVLDSAYHEVQSQVHPDKFVNASDAEKRVAMQWATRANEAYLTLKKPLQRARYLCELNGADLQIESNTSMPREFLMQQMEWREMLDDAKTALDVDALEKLEQELLASRRNSIGQIGLLLDAGVFAEAALEVRKLMFLEKFRDELSDLIHTIA